VVTRPDLRDPQSVYSRSREGRRALNTGQAESGWSGGLRRVDVNGLRLGGVPATLVELTCSGEPDQLSGFRPIEGPLQNGYSGMARTIPSQSVGTENTDGCGGC
jgi:hypothetical protein